MTADTALAPHGGQTLRRSTRYRTLKRFARHRLAMFGLVVIVLLVLACAVGPSLVPFDQFQLNMRARFREPFVSVHLLGTDELGRDMLARLLMAGRMSPAMRQILVDAAYATSMNDGGGDRVEDMVFLIASSPQFAVQR